MGRRSWPVRDIVEIYLHWQAGGSLQSVARSLGIDRKTVRRYVRAAREAGMKPGEPARTAEEWSAFVRERFPELVNRGLRSSWFGALDAHQEFIREGLRTNCASTVWQRLCSQTEVKVSLSTFRRYVRVALPEVVDPKEITVWRPEVEPGEEAQVDFGSMGLWEDPRTGKRRRVWAFVMVLAFSRHMFVRLVLKLDAWTWLRCHVEGFAFFDALPQRLLLDYVPSRVMCR